MNTTVDRTGVFRVKSTEHGLGQTRKAGYPQYNVQTKVTAYYDEESELWVDFSDTGMEIGVRQCLFGMVGEQGAKKVGTTLSYDQVCKVFKWDGADLRALANIKPGVEFQVTLKDNDPEYADQIPYQVEWIDEFDADPKRKITKCTPEEIDGLQAKYVALLKAKAKPTAPAKAPKKISNKKAAGIKDEPGVIKKKVKSIPPPPSPVASPPSKQVDNYTKTDAWRAVVDLKADNITDAQLKAAWEKAINEVSNNQGEEILDGEGWWKAKDRVLDAIGKF